MIRYFAERKKRKEIQSFVNDMKNGMYSEFHIPEINKKVSTPLSVLYVIMIANSFFGLLIGAGLVMAHSKGYTFIMVALMTFLPVLWMASIATIVGDLE
jgi:hypothetical protein